MSLEMSSNLSQDYLLAPSAEKKEKRCGFWRIDGFPEGVERDEIKSSYGVWKALMISVQNMRDLTLLGTATRISSP